MAWLLFLEQGTTNEIRPLTPGQALPRLFQMASVPWYDAEYLDDALAACGRIVAGGPLRRPHVPAGNRRDRGCGEAVGPAGLDNPSH